tara:strand:- start:41 stop:355 length:315 start_codon:yes stop_codon:yes gene_type:complete
MNDRKENNLIFEAYEDDKKDPKFWVDYLVNAWNTPRLSFRPQIQIVHDEVDKDTFREIFELIRDDMNIVPDGKNSILSYMTEFDPTLKREGNPGAQPPGSPTDH